MFFCSFPHKQWVCVKLLDCSNTGLCHLQDHCGPKPCGPEQKPGGCRRTGRAPGPADTGLSHPRRPPAHAAPPGPPEGPAPPPVPRPGHARGVAGGRGTRRAQRPGSARACETLTCVHPPALPATERAVALTVLQRDAPGRRRADPTEQRCGTGSAPEVRWSPSWRTAGRSAENTPALSAPGRPESFAPRAAADRRGSGSKPTGRLLSLLFAHGHGRGHLALRTDLVRHDPAPSRGHPSPSALLRRPGYAPLGAGDLVSAEVRGLTRRAGAAGTSSHVPQPCRRVSSLRGGPARGLGRRCEWRSLVAVRQLEAGDRDPPPAAKSSHRPGKGEKSPSPSTGSPSKTQNV
nr:skin secretory protein xP2 [Equus caballus]XP_023488451.1 skin secretory protein xP2 [Equus caballus]XP_023488452.1 skin secretory protein xP2 [Equus caballus]XP_023488453.1 skin secretory protein xP2 [Equus caballus]